MKNTTTMKATNQIISEVLRKRIALCTKEELGAVLRLVGFTVKEYYSSDIKTREGQKHVYFEIHHQIYYCMSIDGESDVRAYSYHNEYLQEMGYSIPTENVAELIQIMLNMWVPRFPFEFAGPIYNEERDRDYGSIEELSALLAHLQAEMKVILDIEEKPSMDLPVEKVRKKRKS